MKEVLEYAESLSNDKTKLMCCLNTLMAIATIGRDQYTVDTILKCLDTLEHKPCPSSIPQKPALV